MKYIKKYKSPLGELLLISNDMALLGIWFENGKAYHGLLGKELTEGDFQEKNNNILDMTSGWLDIYFSGKNPNFTIPIELHGTSFQNRVWEILLNIPYGTSVSYGEIANIIAKEKGISKMSAQAVGQAVGSNKISILVPCHRVLGVNGEITGYGGGVKRKKALLELENISFKF